MAEWFTIFGVYYPICFEDGWFSLKSGMTGRCWCEGMAASSGCSSSLSTRGGGGILQILVVVPAKVLDKDAIHSTHTLVLAIGLFSRKPQVELTWWWWWYLGKFLTLGLKLIPTKNWLMEHDAGWYCPSCICQIKSVWFDLAPAT